MRELFNKQRQGGIQVYIHKNQLILLLNDRLKSLGAFLKDLGFFKDWAFSGGSFLHCYLNISQNLP